MPAHGGRSKSLQALFLQNRTVPRAPDPHRPDPSPRPGLRQRLYRGISAAEPSFSKGERATKGRARPTPREEATAQVFLTERASRARFGVCSREQYPAGADSARSSPAGLGAHAGPVARDPGVGTRAASASGHPRNLAAGGSQGISDNIYMQTLKRPLSQFNKCLFKPSLSPLPLT